jgi:hypothetical protein
VEQFIDHLSKQLAKTTSRRSILSITLRTVSAAIVTSTGIGKLWAQTSLLPGDVGSSSCGVVQEAIQLAFPDPSRYKNHGAYVSSVANSVSAAQSANLITSACSGCIVSQFARGVSVEQQQSCGTIVQPTQNCSSKVIAKMQIQTAAVLSLGAAPNAWSDPQEWNLLVQLTDGILGCQIEQGASVSAAVATAKVLSAATVTANGTDPVTSCSTPGVNYCGPDNSLQNPSLSLINYAPCLNTACFQHDNCYGEQCPPIARECDFTAQTTQCDNPLLAACMGSGTCTPTEISNPSTLPGTSLVCGLVSCFTGTLPLDTPLGNICASQNSIRSRQSQCQGTTSQCLDCSGVGEACGSVCCPCGQSCVDGSCTCAPGQTFCVATGSTASTCCPAGTICSDGSCITCSSGAAPCGTTCCSSGETCCGTKCCSSGQTCSNGVCSNGVCTDSTCPPGHPCCVSFYGQPGCTGPGYYCCPGGFGACPVGTTCCGEALGTSASALACCQPGQTCVVVPGQGTYCSG